MSYPYADLAHEDVVDYVPTNARSILDVGCAHGGFGKHLLQARPGVEVWGIEPNAEAFSHAKGRLTQTIHGSYPDDIPEGCRFDCIVFIDVLEHFVDPWAVLRATANHLTNGGQVVAVIPNVRNARVVFDLLMKGQWRYQDTGILDRTHLRFFTRETIEDLFTGSGYLVDHIEPLDVETGGYHRLLRLLGSRGIGLMAKTYVTVAATKGSLSSLQGPG